MNAGLLGLLMGSFFLSQAHAATAVAPGVKLGTVDMQKILMSVAAGKKARESLEVIFNKRKKELQESEAEVKKLHEQFQKKSLAMNEQARAEKQAEIQQRIMMLNQMGQKSQEELAAEETKLKAPIIKHIKELVAELAKEKSYTMVFEGSENNVIYSMDQDNLTEEAIKRFDKKFGSKLISN